MKFTFKNLGIIKEADIELNGLTVIAGLNDTGKSFLGKAIFAIVKTINEAKEQQKTEQWELIQNSLTQMYTVVRQTLIITPEINAQVTPSTVVNQISIAFNVQSNAPLDSAFIINLISNYKDRVIHVLDSNASLRNVTSDTNNPLSTSFQKVTSAKKTVENLYYNLLNVISTTTNEEDSFKSFFEKVIIKRFFQNQINSYGDGTPLEIKITEGGNEIINVRATNNAISAFQLKDIMNYKDATLIESPIILQLTRFISSTLLFQGPVLNKRISKQRSELPYHMYDLAEKLFASSTSSSTEKITSLYNEISQIINGKVILEQADQNFYYIKNSPKKIKDGQRINSFNIATGVKSFGLLQLLLASDYINPKSLLIIDEPEVHLHPKWEIEYARIIVVLSSMGIPILVSSHSPYFIEAIATFKKEYKTDEITKFYLGHKVEEEGYTKFEDVTENLNPIFKKLAEPMQKLFFR